MKQPAFNRRGIPVVEWPELDRQAWAAAQAVGDDLLCDDHPASRWRESTKELHSRCYGLWLAWLAAEGLLLADQPPGDRMTRERLRDYLRAQRARGSGARTLVNHAVGLRHMFEALAPERDWTWMLPAIGALKSAVETSRNHFDLPSIRELFALGFALMRRAEGPKGGSPKQRAVMFRNGLAIAMLAARPMMRRNNLATIRIGHHLVREAGFYHLRFSAGEMKGRRRRGGPLPAILTEPIGRYLVHHRPTLVASKRSADKGTAVEDAFFVSALGNPVYPHALSNEIGETTEAAFGRRVTAHEFRHAAASSIAKEDPVHVEIVPSILGHADYRTSEGYYIFAEEHAAFGRLDEVFEQLSNKPF